ncbi:Mevalonate kinase [Coemansia sp. RSA 989]|nr:ribosomal protein S5 domain 2-type protein [Coemansia mojavensis]KAJ1738337.1 Mevalonate kinase [Coemansia sp. RSA 1086]KAJ1746724.1 Mevalonate kinase [Coemansia sp. RSA 1821]KAJ1864570.1 Mevalonate kinase [Coemansia sp. RSA 989]KAJ2671718.1 Mevalonate kinase [Coemansia sp. RSA 1085]
MVVAIAQEFTPFLVSAPGKLILFGEHAVVYGKTAIAGSVDMRAYALVTPRSDNTTRLVLPDINVDVQFNKLPRLNPSDLSHPCEVENHIGSINVPEGPGRMAVLTFVYLFGCLLAPRPLGFTVCVRSLLPVGAGLGSSASFNVALATALLQLSGQLRDDGQSTRDRRLINQWAFAGEQVAHGTPSGIDNSVATYGGFLAYTKGQSPQNLNSSSALRVLITNTNVPKSTKALVAGVRLLRDKHPQVIDGVLDTIHNVSISAISLFESQGEDVEDKLQDIIRLNHGMLSTLGVSHLSLERIREITAMHNMASKLTGAGGGGCALTLVPSTASDETVENVKLMLAEEGFKCYQTTVGGAGVVVTHGVGSQSIVEWIRSMLDRKLSLAPSAANEGTGYDGVVSAFSILPDAAIAKLAP